MKILLNLIIMRDQLLCCCNQKHYLRNNHKNQHIHYLGSKKTHTLSNTFCEIKKLIKQLKPLIMKDQYMIRNYFCQLEVLVELCVCLDQDRVKCQPSSS